MRTLTWLVTAALLLSACSGVSQEEHDVALDELADARGDVVSLQALVSDRETTIEGYVSRVAELEAELAAAEARTTQLEERLGADIACGAYRGVVCQGWVTDAAQVLSDRDALEDAADAFVGRLGHQIAIVVVPTTGGLEIGVFADELGNTWGVGDALRNDGIVVLVDIGVRMTWVTTGPGVDLGDEAPIAAAGNALFGAGDFDAGVLAILEAIESVLTGDS